MNALAQLIQQRKQELALNLKQIADRSQGSVSVALLGKWLGAHTLDGLPRVSSINGLATALELPPVRVLLAAAQAAGLDITDPVASDLAAQLPTHVDELEPESRELLLKTAWQLQKLQDREGASGSRS